MLPLSEKFVDSLHSIGCQNLEKLIASLDTPPSVSIRLNGRKAGADAVLKGLLDAQEVSIAEASEEAEEERGSQLLQGVDWCETGYYLGRRPLFTKDPLLHAGAYYVQDASSMIYYGIAKSLVKKLREEATTSSPVVLDFCAAPGGKSTAMIDALPDGSTIVANEYVATRGKILRENLEKWGYPGVITTGSSAEQYSVLPPIFDIIAVDAPCSGEGMMRKDEEARRQWSEGLTLQCASLQREILSNVANTLKPGGYLIYSTCTFNLEENERNSLFIKQQLGFHSVSLDSLNLSGIRKCSRALLPGVEALRFMPHLTRGEGLYVSVFRKPQTPDATQREDLALTAKEEKISTVKGKKTKGGAKASSDGLNPAMQRLLEGWIKPEYKPHFEEKGQIVTMLPGDTADVVEYLRKYRINITGAGLPVAELKGRTPRLELIPDSRLSLNTCFNRKAFPSVDLNLADALRFLRREALTLPPNIPKGFVVVTYEDVPLGMMKNLGNRANNLLPQAWRIRMA